MTDGFSNPFLDEESEDSDLLVNPFLKKKKDGFSNPFINELPAAIAVPPAAVVSAPSLAPVVPPVDPTVGYSSPTSGVTETNALLAQQIADQNRAAQMANAPNVTELDSVFYPKTFDPAVTGQNALETERQRLAQVLGEAGPTIAKTEMNINPSISQVQGLPGNYQAAYGPVAGMPISDNAAADLMAFGNTYQMPNNAVSRGTGRMLGVFNLFAQQLGLKDTGDYIDRMQELNRIIPEAPKEVQDGLRAITAEDNTWGEAFRAMKENPGAVLSVVGESLPQMIPSLLAATGVTLATGGNIFAGAAAVGATSGAIEFGNVLDEEIRSSGVDLNDDAAMQELFDNPEFWGRARERGARRGIAIGLFDALSMGMAGKLVNMARGAGKGRLTVGGAAAADVAGVQGPFGSVGEFTAQMLEKQGGFRDGLNFGEIALEGIAEIVPGAGEVAVATTAGTDPVALAAKQTMRDIDNAEFKTTPQQEAIALLSPQDMPLEAQITDLQMRLRAVGQDKMAGTYGTWLDRLDALKPEQLKFLKQKVEEEERKAGGVASLQPRDENVFESFLAQGAREKVELDQALEDTRTGPILREMAKNMQMIGDRLHELGYNYSDVSRDPDAPQEIKNARDYLANAGIAMRLVKQLNANIKGYKGNRSVSDEQINQTIGRLQLVISEDVLPRIEGAPPNPNVQTDLTQPDIPTADGDLQPPPANQQPVNAPILPEIPQQPAAFSQPNLETDNPIKPTAAQNIARASVLEGATRSMLEMDETAANAMLDELEIAFPGIKAQILSYKKPAMPTVPESGPNVQTSTEQPTVPVSTDESFSVAFGDSVGGLTVSSSDTTANINTVEVRNKEVTGIDGVTYKSIFDLTLPFGTPVNLVVEKNGKLSVSTASKVKTVIGTKEGGEVTGRPNFVAATIILPLNATDAQISAAVKESRRQWSATYKGVITSEAVPDTPNVVTKPVEAPVVQTSTEQPTVPVIEDKAPDINPQDAKPVGREVPNKPVTSVQSPDGQATFNVQGRVIELADLKQATGDLQPRDRSRKDSDALAKERAGSMFNPERLLDDPTSGSGAPIIARDGTVMSGNGRVLTMQEVYTSQPESLSKYRSALEGAGISTEGFSQPVFVRQLTDDMTVKELKRFADLSNTEAQAQMSMTERANRDSTRLTDSGIIDLYRGDFDIDAAQNRSFINEYAKKILSPTEQGAFVNSKGEISQEGISRVKNAILASAFDNPDTLATMLESSDENIKAISSAFMASAPKFAQLKKQIADGRTDAQFDITPQLADMANLVSRLRRDGVKLNDYYNQSDMLSAPDPEVQSIVRAFYNQDLTRANSAKAMKDFLTFYADEALQKEAGGLIPDDTTASDIIEAGRQRTEEKRDGGKRQAGLELAASSNVKRNDARSKQVPKRRDAESSERVEAVKPAAERKVDDARSESAVEKSVEGVAELRDTDSTSPANADTREENTRGTKAGRVTIAQSQTLRQSLYRDAFTDAGFDADTAVNLPITRQYKILSDLVTKKFGLSFVEKPRQGAGYDQVNALLDAYHNLQWMTHTMAMPNKAIGLDGTLGLALPQNAWGGYLAAYVNKQQTDPDSYSSDINPVVGPVILMPGRSNSFAHEWGHALDYHILDRIGNDWGRGVTGRIRTNLEKGEMVYADNAPQNVVEAMGDLMNAMFMENAEVSAQIMKIEGEVARLQAKQDKRTSGKPIKKLADMKEQLRKLREGSSKKPISKSQYRKDAETFATDNKSDVSYWTRPTEMFARAFEAYIARNVEAAGGNTEFITFENEAYKMALDKVKGGDDRLALTYPNDPDRMRIFMAMDRLLDELRADVIQEGTIAEAPGDTDMIDAQAIFYESIDLKKNERVNLIAGEQKAWREHQAMRLRIKNRPSIYKSSWAKFQDNFGVNFINTKRGYLFNLASRYKDNARAKELIESIIARVATDPGSTGNRVTVAGGTFEEAAIRKTRAFAAVFSELVAKHDLNSFSEADMQQLRLFLTSDQDAQTNAEPRIKRAAGEIRNRLLNPMYDYMRKNKFDVNYLPEGGYMPRMMDALLAISDREKFMYGGGKNKRGAKNLYSEVIYETEYGALDTTDADQARGLVNLSRRKKIEALLEEETIETATELSDILSQIKRESAKADDPEVDAGDIEAAIEKLQEEAAELHADLYEALRDPYGEVAATDWFDRITHRQVGDISRHGVQGDFSKSRKLPPEADTYMVDFYLNPVEALAQYIPGVARKVEFEKRFGTQNVPKGERTKTSGTSIDGVPAVHDYVSYAAQEMATAGMKPHEIEEIQFIVKAVTGTGNQADSSLSKVLNTLNTYGTMALLPRAVISSVAEPMTAAVTTGKVTDGFRVFAYALDEFGTSMRGQTAKERKQYYKQLGSILGVIDLPESGEVIANRVGGTSADDTKNAGKLAWFFRRTGLVAITNAQRRGSLRVGIRYISELGEQYTNPSSPRMKDRARESLQDFGVLPEDMDQFAEFASSMEKSAKGMYDVNNILDRSGSLTDMGEILSLAAQRFTDQTIQDPKIIDRPKWAETPLGRIVFGIQSFIAAFQRNVLIASGKRIQREYENRGAASAIPYAAINVALPLFSLYLSHTMVSAVREAIFNPDKWEEEKEAGNLEMYLLTLGLSRSGFFGRTDPLVNALTSLKYQSDLSNMMVGASGAYYFKALQRIAGLYNNSPNTLSAEYQAGRGAYDLVVPTALSFAASYPGFGPLTGAAAGISAAVGSSPAVKHWMLRNVIYQLYGEEYRPGRAGRKKKSDDKGYKW